MMHVWLVAVYVVTGKLALLLALPPGYASPIFPAAGIAIAAAFIAGRKVLPAIFIGSLLLNLWISYSTSPRPGVLSFEIAFMIALASMLQAGIAGRALRHLIGYPTPLSQGSDISRFLLLSPVLCLTSATLSVSALWLLGVVDHEGIVEMFASWWIGDALGLVIAFPLVLSVAGEPRKQWRSRIFTVALPMLVVLVLFVAIYFKANQWEHTDSLAQFRQQSSQLADQIRSSFNGQESLVEQVASLFLLDQRAPVTREQFRLFVDKSLQRFSMIQAISWEYRVEESNRAHFEALQSAEIANFEIRERDAAGHLQRAGARPSYFPVTYIEPVEGNRAAIGFDLMSNPSRAEALNKSIQLGVAITSAPLHLVQEKQQQEGVLLLMAVPKDHPIGAVSSVLRMGDFMDALLPQSQPLLFARLIDLDAQKVVYDHFSSNHMTPSFVEKFEFGSRHYQLETVPTPLYLQQHRGWQSWGILGGGALAVGLMGALLLLGTGYTSRMQEEVTNRTNQLRERELYLRTIVENEPECIAVIDASGSLIQVNPAGLGYLQADLLEQVQGLAVLPFIAPEFRQPFQQLHERVLAGESMQMVCEVVGLQGRHLWMEVHAVPMQRQGEVIHLAVMRDITLRKQLEEVKEESLRQLQKVASSVPGMVYQFLLRPDGSSCLPFASEAIRDIFRVTPEEVRTDAAAVFATLHPDDYDDALASIHHSAATLLPWYHEWRIRFPDGTVNWLYGNAIPEKQQDGSVLWYGFISNIDTRKQAEQALKDSEATFRAMAETLPLAIYVSTGLEQRCEYINHTFIEWFGYSMEEVPTVAEWWPIAYPDPNYRQQLEAEWQRRVARAIEEGSEIEAMETVVSCRDGSKKTILWGFVALGDKNYAFGLDLTERKQSEASYRKLAQVVEQAGEAIMITDIDGVIEYVNPAFTQLTGYHADAVIGKTPRILNSGKYAPDFYEEIWQTVTAGHIWQGKVIDRKEDGTFYPAMETISPIRNEQGEITNYIGLQLDLSENEALESRFYQAQKMEALGTLVGGIAHEFNNVLAGITGNLYLARKQVANADVVLKKLDSIETLAFSSAYLIKNLLSFARKGIIQKTSFDLPVFIRETLKVHRVSLPENVTLTIEIDPIAMVVEWDATLLQQVVLNLVNNARDAVNGLSHPIIIVTLKRFLADSAFLHRHPELHGSEYACLSVTDNGTGIDADHLPHIFEPFYTSKEVGKGTGLGLSMVTGAVQTHHGAIEVESVPGAGTTFRLYLPLLPEEKNSDRLQRVVDGESGCGELILLADDEQQVLEVGKEVLEVLGYRVLLASDGLEAVKIFQTHKDEISLVITDIMMPNLGGVDAVERMRAIRSDIKVIFTTGYNREEERLGHITAVKEAVLYKPYEIDALSKTIRAQLQS
ncbi:PAS domain S-box protein [Mariprofundus erugo]|uniref:PAS domain S-box protein n=1 Tax=Mariprofundus erugo TaxID=2528639 RepID=UPI0010FD54CF|nr:PAS domain S-box protein [Mariprofundus erugo]TLS76728.1 PAS domain S-box protein [Mariprofundus erugo]